VRLSHPTREIVTHRFARRESVLDREINFFGQCRTRGRPVEIFLFTLYTMNGHGGNGGGGGEGNGGRHGDKQAKGNRNRSEALHSPPCRTIIHHYLDPPSLSFSHPRTHLPVDADVSAHGLYTDAHGRGSMQRTQRVRYSATSVRKRSAG